METEETAGNEVDGDNVLPSTNASCIAKLYGMKGTSDWEEVYVGFCVVLNEEGTRKGIAMVGIDEKEGETLFLPIDKRTKYEPYGEVLILWKEVLCSYSLSFLTKEDRDNLLEQIQQAQELTGDSFKQNDEDETPLNIPKVSIENVHAIYTIVSEADISQKDAFHSLLVENNFQFIRDLFALFPELEATGQKERIQDLVSLCRLILDLGYDDVVGILFSDDLFLQFFGIMEYRPELSQKAEYRQFFQTQVHWRNTMPNIHPELSSLIHRLYRLFYYRVCVMSDDGIDPQPTDDIVSSGLASQIRLCIGELLQLVCNSPDFVPDLWKSLSKSEEDIVLALRVINELCSYVRNMTVGNRAALMLSLDQTNRLSTLLHQCLQQPLKPSTRMLIFQMIEYRADFGINSWRRYIEECKNESTCLLMDVVRGMWDESYEVQLAAHAILMSLFNTDDVNANSLSSLINIFYDHYSLPLIQPLLNFSSSSSSSSFSSSSSSTTATISNATLANGIELTLNFLGAHIENHGTNLQFLILKNNLFPVVLAFLRKDARRLQLCSAQFISQCVLSGVEWYTKYIIKRDHLAPLLAYAEDHIEEEHCVMGTIMACIREILRTGEKPLCEYLKGKLENYQRLKHSKYLSIDDQVDVESKRVRLDSVL